jgi:hypothetical protein
MILATLYKTQNLTNFKILVVVKQIIEKKLDKSQLALKLQVN